MIRIVQIYGPRGCFHALQIKHPERKKLFCRDDVYSLSGEKLKIPAEWLVIAGIHLEFFNAFWFYTKEWKDRIKDSNYDNKVNWHRLRRIREMK